MRFLAVLLLCFGVSAQTLNPGNSFYVGGVLKPAAGGGGGNSFTDTFTRSNADALGNGWTEVAGDTDIVGNAAVTQTTGFGAVVNIKSDTTMATVNQYVKLNYSAGSSGAYVDAYLRYNDSSSPYYVVQFADTENEIYWVYKPSVAGGGTTIKTQAHTVPQAGSYGITITGTGNSTEVRIWVSPTADAPTSASLWDGAAPTYTFTDDPSTADDSGGLIGFGGFASDVVSHLDISGGDIP